MNIKNRLQKITIILATFLILFNFMGSTMVYATITVSNDVITWIQENCGVTAEDATKNVAKAFDVEGVTGLSIDNGNLVIQYSGDNWESTQKTITDNLGKTYMGENASIFFTKENVTHTSNTNNNNNTNANNATNNNKNEDISNDPIVNWILNKYSQSIQAPTAAQAVKNAILSVNGVTGISIKNGKLHIEYNGQWNTIRGNIERNFKNTHLQDSDIDIFFNDDRFEHSGTETNATEDEYSAMSEKEQFFYWIGKHMAGIDDAVKEQYYYWYTSDQLNSMGQKSVEVTKDENGNITNIVVNLDQDQADATNNSDVEAGRSDAGEYWDKEAEDKGGIESLLIVPTVGLITACVDGVYKVFQNFILGTNTSIGSTIASALPWAGNHIVITKKEADDASKKLIISGSSLTEEEKNSAVHIQWNSDLYHIPTMILTPAAIFEGKVAALNGNFFDTDDAKNEIGGENMSTVGQLKSTVSGWYITLRNIAVVGLLSVLIYIGIRIIISTSNSDKAKYKQFFMDWIIALCLIFFMHYIMSFIMTVTDSVTAMMASDQGEDGTYQAKEVLVSFGEGNASNGKYMYTSFAGVARMRLQYAGTATKLGYMVMYIAFVGYTVYFSVIYLKRILYLSFFTMIAPLVALTYPLDKIKDGKAQAFNFWFKEYIFYAMLQPLHLFLYTVLIKSAMALASKNMIYAIVAMAFIVPAEKIVKSMFGIRGQTEGNLGGLMGLSAATHMFQLLRKPPKMPQGAGKGNGGESEGITDNPESGKFDSLFTSPSTTSNDNNGLTVGSTQEIDDSVRYNEQQQLAISEQKRAQIEAEQKKKEEEEEERNRRALSNGQLQNPGILGENTSGISTKEQEKQPRIKQLHNNARTAIRKRFVAAGGYKGLAMKAGKGLAKGYMTAAGTVGLGAVGLGLGMVGGDLNNAWQGLVAGAGVGAYVGNNVGKEALNTISATASGKNALGAFTSEVWNGEEESIRLREENAYMNDQANIARIQAEHGDWDYEQIQNHAKREYNMQRDSGVHDTKLANKAIKLEDEFISQGSTPADAHEHAYKILQGTKVYDKSMFYNKKKLNEARETMVENRMASKNVSREEAVAHTNKIFKEIGQVYGVGKVADMPAWNEPKIDENAKNSGRVTSSVKNGGNNVKTPKKTPRKSNRKK